MRRRHFRVSLLMGKEEKVKSITQGLYNLLMDIALSNFAAGKPKVTYIRPRPWWKFWK